eukprot:Ihof_evm3s120 gene=Ihof_evmTU3s120
MEEGRRGLGIETFVATSHGVEECGLNGLPLTPHSINIIGRFQWLKSLQHNHLCEYVDICKEQDERLDVVSEHHNNNMECVLATGIPLEETVLVKWAFQLLLALSYLNEKKLVHRNLSPSAVLLDHRGDVKLSRYGLFYMTNYGEEVPFPIGIPRYMSPDLLTASHIGDKAGAPSCTNPKVDIWTVGLILLELHLGRYLWCDRENDLQALFTYIMSLGRHSREPTNPQHINSLNQDHRNEPVPTNGASQNDSIKQHTDLVGYSALDEIINDQLNKRNVLFENQHGIQPLSDQFTDVLRQCLMVRPCDRPTPAQLLSHPLFYLLTLNQDQPSSCFNCSTHLPMLELNFKANDSQSRLIDVMPLKDVYYFWKISGNDVHSELAKRNVTHTTPPICQIPFLVRVADSSLVLRNNTIDRWHLYSPTITPLMLTSLNERLTKASCTPYSKKGYTFLNKKDLLDLGVKDEAISAMTDPLFNNGQPKKQPIAVRERDIDYQYHRTVLYRGLLKGYPYSIPAIRREAHIDVPPPVRGQVWAALLGVCGDVDEAYRLVDTTTPHPIDRQIDVDIPRCHQYDVLLSSSEGHSKLRRLLKGWVSSNPHYVYWQGLDSLAAPFLWHHFNHEAMAYACLDRFVKVYLNGFFLPDNSEVIHEYIAVYRHVLAYHEPELAYHLDKIGFLPELYAIPWFLTVYTHVFPLEQIATIWDTVLQGCSVLPLCIAVAIMSHLKAILLNLDFNACILFFSDSLDVNLDACMKRAKEIGDATPSSVVWRRYDTWAREKIGLDETKSDQMPSSFPNMYQSRSAKWELPIPLEIMKKERIARIRLEDVMCMSQCLVVDIRDDERFVKGHWKGCLHVPYSSLYDMLDLLLPYKGGNIVVLASKPSSGAKFGWRLVTQHYPK